MSNYNTIFRGRMTENIVSDEADTTKEFFPIDDDSLCEVRTAESSVPFYRNDDQQQESVDDCCILRELSSSELLSEPDILSYECISPVRSPLVLHTMGSSWRASPLPFGDDPDLQPDQVVPARSDVSNEITSPPRLTSQPHPWGDIEDQTLSMRFQHEPLILNGIYFFQGDPFCYRTLDLQLVEMGRLDRQTECQQLTDVIKESSCNKVCVFFDLLTIDSLGDFFSMQKGPVLHLSTHGTKPTGDKKAYLAFEDESHVGMMRPFLMEEFVKWVSRVGTGKSVRLCFVASCYTEHLGQALVSAGIPHVVCCRSEARVHDKVALDFEVAFYKYLVCEHEAFDIQAAFDTALFEIKEKYGEEHANKFCLLPNDTKNPNRHKVPVQIQKRRDGEEPQRKDLESRAPMLLPPPLPLYVCRAAKQQELITALLKGSSYISVSGGAGVGKTEIVRAVGHYLYERLHFKSLRWKVTEIVWCPYDHRPNRLIPWLQGDHSNYHHVQKIFDVIRDNHVTVQDFVGSSVVCHHMSELQRFLHCRKALLIIVAKALDGESRAEKMAVFVKQLLSDAAHTKVMVIHNNDFDFNPGTLAIRRHNIVVEPLDFFKSKDLFMASLKSEVVSKDQHGFETPQELGDWLFAKNVIHAVQCRRCPLSQQMRETAKNLFQKLGDGMPSRIVQQASRMTAKSLDDIISIRHEFEESSDYATRVDLCKALQKLRQECAEAEQNGLYVQVKIIRRKIWRLENYKRLLKSLPELRELFCSKELELAQAVFKEDDNAAIQYSTQLQRIERSIENEEAALNSCIEDEDFGPFLRIQTRHELEIEISLQERRLDVAWEHCEWTAARKIASDLNVLEDHRKFMPTLEQLEEEIATLSERIADARLERNVPVAKVLYQHRCAKETQRDKELRLASEEETESKIFLNGSAGLLFLSNDDVSLASQPPPRRSSVASGSCGPNSV